MKIYIKQFRSMVSSSTIYWVTIISLCLIKLILVSDLAPKIINVGHDDFLYVKRAYAFLVNGSLGQFDSQLLVKLPGISYLLAFFRFLGIPSFLAYNALLMGAALYLVDGMQRNRIPRWAALLSFAFIIFHPFSECEWWIRVIREPANLIFHYLLFGSLLKIYDDITHDIFSLGPILVLAGSFALAILTREENILLFAFLAMAFVSSLLLGWRMGTLGKIPVRLQLAMLLIVPLVIWPAGDSLMRYHIQKHYGLPLLHEFSEGEYPKFIAAVRSVGTDRNDRLISIHQAQLQKISETVPMLKPVIDAMPQPGKDTATYRYWGIEDELANSHIFFWIRDSAFKAGLFQTLEEEQEFFRNGRLAIEKACAEGKLECVPDGSSLMPTFKLNWIGVMFKELPRTIKYIFAPSVPGLKYVGPLYKGSGGHEVGRVFQAVTMTHNYRESLPGDSKDDLSNAFCYWLRYPDVAKSRFGPNHEWDDGSGALAHYRQYGKKEGRIWGPWNNDDSQRLGYFSLLDSTRAKKNKAYFATYPYVVGLTVLCILVFAFFFKQSLQRPLALLGLVLGGYSLIKTAALMYISVPMGPVGMYMYSSLSPILYVLSPALAIEAFRLIRLKLKKVEGG